MAVIPIGARLLSGGEIIQEGVIRCNRALGDKGRPIGIRSVLLEEAVLRFFQ